MKTISPTLLAAQKQSTHNPTVKVEIIDKQGDVNRLSWSSLYSGPETATVHDATIPGDNSLVRAYVDIGGALYVQHIPDPGPGSNFSTWTNTGITAGTLALALCSHANIVRLFYTRYDAASSRWGVCYIESIDYGASWGPETALAWNSYQWLRFGADFNDDGSAQLLVISDGNLPNSVFSLKWTSTSGWGTPSPWTNTGIFRWIFGWTIRYHQDWNIVFGAKKEYALGVGGGLWQCLYGDGTHQNPDTWSAPEPIIAASGASNLEFRFPHMDRLTEDSKSIWRLYFTEMFTGSTSYTRNYYSHGIPNQDFYLCLWHDPIPMESPSQENAPAINHTSFAAEPQKRNKNNSSGFAQSANNYAFLTTANIVWRAPLHPSNPPTTNVSPDVISVETSREEFDGGAVIELRNDDGRYADFPYDGQQIEVSFGFTTPDGDEYPDFPLTFWIEQMEYVSKGKTATVRLHAIDCWGALRTWRTRNQYAWSGTKSIKDLLRWVLARKGFNLELLPGCSTALNTTPTFTIHPNESGDTAVRRLVQMVTEKLLWRKATACLKYPAESENPCYNYGSDHPIYQGNYNRAAFEINHTQVFGSSVMEERMRWDQIQDFNDRLRQIIDINLSDPGEAGWRAMAELRNAWFESAKAKVEVPINCAQELFDCVNVYDPRWSLETVKKRVLALNESYNTQTSLYLSIISLGAP